MPWKNEMSIRFHRIINSFAHFFYSLHFLISNKWKIGKLLNVSMAKVRRWLIWYSISLITWQFYKSFSSGLKDIVWKSEETVEGLRYSLSTVCVCTRVWWAHLIDSRFFFADHNRECLIGSSPHSCLIDCFSSLHI